MGLQSVIFAISNVGRCRPPGPKWANSTPQHAFDPADVGLPSTGNAMRLTDILAPITTPPEWHLHPRLWCMYAILSRRASVLGLNWLLEE